LYTRKENKVPNENVVKGKTKVPLRKLDWVPVKENPSGVGFQRKPLQWKIQLNISSKDIAAISFSFALQHISDAILRCVLPYLDNACVGIGVRCSTR